MGIGPETAGAAAHHHHQEASIQRFAEIAGIMPHANVRKVAPGEAALARNQG